MAGHKIWTERQKAVRLISESKKVVSVLDEAFTILSMKKYWARWQHEGATAKWTDSRQGNYQYMGGPMWRTHVLINCAPFYEHHVRMG
jgi:hypothetical protein